MRSVLIIAALAAALAANGAAAQYQRGRQRSDMPREDSKRDEKKAPTPAYEPYAALERELLSLKVDIKLTAAQVDAWNVFERDVRQLAELDRSRMRQQFALRDASHDPPTASKLVGDWADLDRRKAAASADLARHLVTLQDQLDDAQRRMLDRRVALSQSEPLGN